MPVYYTVKVNPAYFIKDWPIFKHFILDIFYKRIVLYFIKELWYFHPIKIFKRIDIDKYVLTLITNLNIYKRKTSHKQHESMWHWISAMALMTIKALLEQNM